MEKNSGKIFKNKYVKIKKLVFKKRVYFNIEKILEKNF